MNLKAWCAVVLCALLALPASALEPAKFVIHGRPAYPREALKKKIQGCVQISFTVRSDGLADNYAIVKSVPPGVFDEATLKALNQSTFQSGDGKTRYYTVMTFYPSRENTHDKRCDQKSTT